MADKNKINACKMTVETKLKVMEALQEEAYKGIVRIDAETMNSIGVRPGDIVEMEGQRITVGIVDRAYPTDVGQAVIRMDGILRRNAKTGIGDFVKVRKADVKEAKSIQIAPAQKGVMVQADPELFKRALLGRALVKGDIVSPGGTRRRKRSMSGTSFEEIFDVFEQGFMGNFGLGGLKFVVVNTAPKSAVIITEQTEISISAKAVEVLEEKVPDVTYEDIGGLDEEIKKIREMVELPLKHPEIFARLGIDPPAGVLLHGPPGSGKTLLAKAVANESEANFMLINGPEVVNKFYGECVAGDSIVLTNGVGLTTIQEAVERGESHKIAGINMDKQKAELLPISDVYDKGIQKTLKVYTPHGVIELTPTSKLLVLIDLEPRWVFAGDIKLGDKVAMLNAAPKVNERIPNILDFLDDTVKFSGEWIRELFNLNGNNKDVSKFLNIKIKTVQDRKYNRSASAELIKKLYKTNFSNGLKLTGKGQIPTSFNKDIMYLLGLLAGDGHLRYNYKDNAVSTITLTNADEKIVSEFKRIIKDNFGIDEIKYDGNYGYYFSSRPIGNLLKNLGIPAKNKSKTLIVPSYLITMPKDLISAYLKGLFDTDGHIHLVKSGAQISYYTSSLKMLNGVKYLLLRLGIQSTFRYKKDGNYELTISDVTSLKNFENKIGFNHKNRKHNLDNMILGKYLKPIYNRIPLKNIVCKIKDKYKLTDKELIQLGVNPNVESYTKEQVERFIGLLHKLNEDKSLIEKIKILKNNDIVWSPIKMVVGSEGHVYDFTVPKDHNFIANGFVVHNSEKRIRDIFEEAEKNSPAIIFIDEIDSIAPKREEVHGEVERRMVSTLLTSLDGLKSRGKVIVIGATNRPNSLDPALRRPGRFDREITIGVPNKKGRLNILKIHTRNMPLAKDVKLQSLADITHGFVGADMQALCKEAAMNVLRRVLPELKLQEKEPLSDELLGRLRVTNDDFKAALKIVRPSALREVLIETPDVKWADVGGLEKQKQELKESIELPLKNPQVFKRLGIKPPKGLLMYGPPGTGKTLLAKAVAHEAEANFISIKSSDLLSMWVGQSEKGVAKVFEKARQVAPTIIFFDEIDSIAPRRGLDFGEKVTERVVNTLLAELDGLEELNDIVFIGCTNRPDILDPALLRPGRFDRIMFMPPPDKESRLEIFKIHTKDMPLAKDVILEKLAEKTEGYVGADINSVCREAALLALRDDINTREVSKKYFEEALKKVRPSVSNESLEAYKAIEEDYFKKAKSGLAKEVPNYMG